MSDYLNFAKQLGLSNATENSVFFDIVGHLYDKFDNLNLGMSYESFLSEHCLNDIISTEALIDDLVAFNDFVEAIKSEQTQRKQEEKQAFFAKFEQETNEFIDNFPFQEGRVAVDKEVRQKKFEEKPKKEQRSALVAYERSVLNRFDELAKLEEKPNVEVKKLQIELTLYEETVKEYIKHMKNELIEQQDKGLSDIYINEPNDWFKFEGEHKKATKYSKIPNSKQSDATKFYTRPITSVDEVIIQTSDVIQKTFDRLKTPFRINFAFNIK